MTVPVTWVMTAAIPFFPLLAGCCCLEIFRLLSCHFQYLLSLSGVSPMALSIKWKKVAQLFIFKNPSMLFGRLNKKNRAKSKKIVITLWFANRNQNLSYMVQLFIVLLKISKAMLLLTSGDQKELSRVRVSSIKDSILHINLRKF